MMTSIWPALAINVVTYNRKETLRGTLQRLDEHLGYTGSRHVIVADDGSDDGTQAMLREEFPQVVVVQSARSGLGANTNAGLRECWRHADYVLQLQDDMHLNAHLDLHPHVELLRDVPSFGFVRLWGVGGHHYEGRLEGNYWRIYWHSPELHIPSDRPHIKHRRFHEFYGMYPEGLKTAQTEAAWCHQCKDRAGQMGRQLDVAVPLGVDTERSWDHMEWGRRWRDQGL